MTDTSSKAKTGDPGASREFREKLSLTVFQWSFGFIAVMTLLVLFFPFIAKAASIDETTLNHKDIYMAVLPILSGWVGGVLGFYFSDRAAEARGEQILQAQNGGIPLSEKLRQVPVTEVMVVRDRIKKIILKTTDTDLRPGSGNNFSELRDVVSSRGFTRAPMFVQKGASLFFRAIAHESVIYKYESIIRDKGKHPDSVSIADFLESDIYRERAADSTAFVSQNATLEDAKARMQNNARGAQDVFVTSTGEANAPVIGWITNMDILRWSIARAED
ncbi:MAG: hypothetical protein CME88_09365 [Hirschia sp.]|nr:hypothetical protein [Hirschia sp.]MBF18573.1 hypothetical protein [Hirschia sp.]|tara:strand:- start:3181 stop:4005 length:825 start_codon:yes stop_codon:yes gene_type:complete